MNALAAIALALGLAFLAGAVLIARRIARHLGHWRVWAGIAAQLAPIREAIDANRDPDAELVARLAEQPATRSALFRMLVEANLGILFPEQYATLAARAESDLAVWLLHPAQLGGAPIEFELMDICEREPGFGGIAPRTYVFRFRAAPPHRLAARGWMAGIAGPYYEPEGDPEPPACVFSDYTPYDNAAPEDHCRRMEARAQR